MLRPSSEQSGKAGDPRAAQQGAAAGTAVAPAMNKAAAPATQSAALAAPKPAPQAQATQAKAVEKAPPAPQAVANKPVEKAKSPAPATQPATAAAPASQPAKPAKASRWGFGRFLRARIGSYQVQVELCANRKQPQLLAAVVNSLGADTLDDAGQGGTPTDLAKAIAAIAPALAALQAKLQSEGAKGLKGLSCDVVIDDSWMLYDVVRADLRGLSPGAADDLIGASLADVAGVSASELSARWQAQGKSAYTLACGLPANALPVLTETLRAHGVTAGTIEGEFVHEYNAHRERLEPKCSVIALVREAGAQLAILVDGNLTSMSFEFGVGSAKELELRGRGLLRVAGVGGDSGARFYAMSAPGWKAPEPWVSIPLAA